MKIINNPQGWNLVKLDNHGGNLGCLFIIAMTITSFPTPASVLGDRGWRILHTVGMYYLWLAFIYSFSKRLDESMLIYLPFISLLTIAIALRLIVPLVGSVDRSRLF